VHRHGRPRRRRRPRPGLEQLEKAFLRGFQQVAAGNGTFSGNPLQVHFGLAAARKYDLIARFPSGAEVVARDIAAAQTIRIIEPEK
jgi:hypothetical protein